jgi:hypothetical protein
MQCMANCHLSNLLTGRLLEVWLQDSAAVMFRYMYTALEEPKLSWLRQPRPPCNALFAPINLPGSLPGRGCGGRRPGAGAGANRMGTAPFFPFLLPLNSSSESMATGCVIMRAYDWLSGTNTGSPLACLRRHSRVSSWARTPGWETWQPHSSGSRRPSSTLAFQYKMHHRMSPT